MNAYETAKKLAIFDTPLYFVGGAVRNRLLNLPVKDYDLAGAVPSEKFLGSLGKIAKKASRKLFTCVVELDGFKFEYTPFRIDSYKGGTHKPEKVTFTLDLEKDALRRDFTCNAVYMEVMTGKIVDPLGGIKDIENKVLRACDIPDKVLGEDGLRLMRLVRFSSELGFSIENKTLESAKKNAALIKDIAPERIREELDKILLADTAYGIKNAHSRGLELLADTGVMAYILPEIYEGKGVEQRKDFHKYDVLGHTIKTVEFAPPEVRLAALFHDAAKPYCMKKQGNMHGHDRAGSFMARDILTRLRYPKEVIQNVSALVELHMYDLKNQAKDITLRRFIQTYYPHIPDLLKLKQADYLGGGLAQGESPNASRIKAVMDEMREKKIPFTVKELAVGGSDLIELKIPEAKRTEALKAVLSAAANGGEMLDKKHQIDILKQYR